MADDRIRRLRAVLRTALTWGAAWGVAGGALVTALALVSPGRPIPSMAARVGMSLLTGAAWGVRFGVAGAVIGTVFAVALGLRYRGRRLAEIDPLRFALLGAVVGGAGVPLFLQLMNVLTGDGAIPWGLVLDDARWSSVFGAAAAAGSILLARRADARSGEAREPREPRPDALDGADAPDALPAAGEPERPIAQRARAARR